MSDEHSAASSSNLQPLEPPRSSLGCTLVTLLVLAGGGYAGWHYYKTLAPPPAEAGGKGAKVHAIPVRVAKVGTMTVPVEVHGVGNVLAYSTVAVTSQVTGQLMKVFFKEGDFVNKGQPLFAIDQRPQQASVDQLVATVAKDGAQIGQLEATVERDRANIVQSRATLLRDEAQARFAKAEEARYRSLNKQGYVTVEQYQQELASEQSAVATVNVDHAAIASAEQTMNADEASIKSQIQTKASDEASLRNAQVQLTYTYITSPVTGRTGGLSVYGGNIVNPGTTQPLVTIYQIRPIYITFAVPEQYLSLIQTLQARSPLQVEVDFNDQQTPPEHGRITFIDNNVDTTTGTIALRGTFPNASAHLWPGRFVTVNLLLENEPNAVVVPSQAVNPGQSGDYVFVVSKNEDGEDAVDMRPVKVERIVGENSVIKSGLKPGETVVTDGQLQLNPKTVVEVLGTKRRGASAQDESTADAAASPDSPGADASGSPEASGSPGGHHHHHHHGGGSPDGSGSPEQPAGSGSPSASSTGVQGSVRLNPLAIPTEPLGAGPAIPPCATGTPTTLGFPASTGTPGIVVIGSSSSSGSGSSSAAAAAAATVAAPTGLPGTVNQPGIITTPGVLSTLPPVTPVAASTIAVGAPNIPSPGPASTVVPDAAFQTPVAASTASTPTTVATATTAAASTPAAPATVTGASTTSAAVGGKGGR